MFTLSTASYLDDLPVYLGLKCKLYRALCNVRTCNKAAKEITAVPSKSSPPPDLLQNWRTNGTLKNKLGIEVFRPII